MIDNDASLRFALEAVLGDAGLTVEACANGSDGLLAVEARFGRIAQPEAQAGEAMARARPGLSAGATYTRNQWEVSFVGLSVLPCDQVDAAVTLSVPLVDLAKFARISAADRSAQAATYQQNVTAREVEAQVVQLY